MNDLAIVVPSRHRTANMERMLKLVPTAIITVDEDEVDDYAKVVPAEHQVIPHPKLPTLAAIRQWVLDNFKQRTVVMLDDDFKGVVSLVGRRVRKITEPDAIMRIIENTAQCARDLELSMFCWQRDPNPMMFSAANPIGIVVPAGSGFGINGRKVEFDVELHWGAELDMTMECLLRERMVYCDRRFYFDFGLIYTGTGGLQGMRKREQVQASTDRLKKRWGQYLDISGRKKRGTDTMAVRVRRQSDVASTR